MSRKLIGYSCMVLLFVTASWAVDLFVGTWVLDIEKAKQTLKYVPSSWTLKLEPLGNGYKFTSKSGELLQVTTVDFRQGETPVRDDKGNETDRIKVVRKSPLEIETTSQKTGTVTNYRIVPSGEMIVTITDRKSVTPQMTLYFKRAS
jgi:hypothetical protein